MRRGFPKTQNFLSVTFLQKVQKDLVAGQVLLGTG